MRAFPPPSLSRPGIGHKTGHKTEHETEHKTDRKTTPRATGLEMALETILKKEGVWCREGLESRSQRARARFDFSNLDPVDFRALGGARA